MPKCSNGQLRTCQVLVFLISGTAGLVVSISVGWTSKILQGQCVLFSNMQLHIQSNGSVLLDSTGNVWGDKTECSFSTFCPVSVTIYCVIWIWFYIFLSDWGTTFIEEKPVAEELLNRPPPDQHLLIPSLVCNILVLGLIMSTLALVVAGRSEWCEHVEQKLKLKEKSCHYVGDVTWLKPKGGEDIYGYLSHASVGCWVLLISMLIQTLIIFGRLRRNSRRPRLDSGLSFMSEPFSDRLSSESFSELPEPFSDSDLSETNNHHQSDTSNQSTQRRRLQRQKRVTINPEVDYEGEGASEPFLSSSDSHIDVHA